MCVCESAGGNSSVFNHTVANRRVFPISHFIVEIQAEMNLIQRTFQPTGRTHTATVICFHGSGDTGHGFIEWIRFLLGKDMEFPHIKVVFPTAPVQPYTPNNGELSNVWFDRKAITQTAMESRSSLAKIYESVNELIRNEVQKGIPPSRIIVGGFSMGGALALHTGYHLNQDLAGVFAMSSFLNNNSIVYDSIRNSKARTLPKLIMFHGDRDSLVPLEWGKTTFDELRKFNVEGEFVPLKHTMHELKKLELQQLIEWIEATLPENIPNKL